MNIGQHFLDIQCAHLLVIEYDIRSPNVITRYVKLLYPAILLRVPLQLVVVPELK